MTQYANEIAFGETYFIGEYLFTAEEIIAFAQKFDPQYFHLDAERAKDSLFGGLCASGWHTACIGMKLLVAMRTKQLAEMKAKGEEIVMEGPSPGFENLQWLKPVMAGDVLRYYRTPKSARPLASRPGWSLVIGLIEAYNQNDELVYCFTGKQFVRSSRPENDKIGGTPA